MERTVEEYLVAPVIELPQQHKEGFSLVNYTVYCAACQEAVVDLRGELTHHAQCIEIHCGGICHGCNLVTFSRARYYGDRLLHWSDNGINEYEARTKWSWKTIKAKVKGWFWKNDN